jgi:hypothetical protein
MLASLLWQADFDGLVAHPNFLGSEGAEAGRAKMWGLAGICIIKIPCQPMLSFNDSQDI